MKKSNKIQIKFSVKLLRNLTKEVKETLKEENYPNAYKEVYEILKFVPKVDLEKIPKKFLEMIEKTMNKNYNFSVDKNIDFIQEQEIMTETKTILAYIFLNYWATDNQKETINLKFKKDIEEAEKQKKELYSNDIFKNQINSKEKHISTNDITVYKKEHFISKVFRKIKSFFKLN